MKVFVTLLLVLASVFCVSAQPSERPNILWIVSEDNSPLIGAYGDEFATTPNIDRLASEGVRYTNAFATVPVCAPSRSTLITGMYPSSVGTLHMRSYYPVPDFVRFFPHYLREAGYYTTNNAKKDYNTVDQPEAWNESSQKATYLNRKEGQPFFAVFNIALSHESSLHTPIAEADLQHDPEKVPIPPYHPRTEEMKHDWAQYYDKITAMDAQVGKILADLDASGERENTIVFYYSDHGGVLGRSKRYMFESGLHVPLIIRVPERFRNLAPGRPGSTTDRLVTFVDFPPTILSLAGIQPPDYLQGKAFLGEKKTSADSYAFSVRGRMDERLDMVRSVRDKKYRYVRNYMPHKIYGQYLEYLWRAPSMPSWEAEWRKGTLNEIQSAFWKPKPPEELYDVEADPHNVNNLAGKEEYKRVVADFRQVLRDWILNTRDVGFVPEPMMLEISKRQALYDYARGEAYPLERIMETAELASSKDPDDLKEIILRLSDSHPVVRYWAATGCLVLGKHAAPATKALHILLQDDEISVRIAAAEALYVLGEKQASLKCLENALKSDNLMARLHALNALEEMGSDAEPAMAAIRRLVDGPEKDGDGAYDLRAARRILEIRHDKK